MVTSGSCDAACIRDLQSTVAELVQRVTVLEAKLANSACACGLDASSSVSASASPTVHVHVGSTHPIGLGGDDACTSSHPSAKEACPPPKTTETPPPPPPTPEVPTAGLDAKIKHYVVITPGPAGQAGTYRSYQKFAEAVKDPDQPWTGRSKIPWAQGAHGQSFATRREAENFYRSELDLSADTVIPFWG